MPEPTIAVPKILSVTRCLSVGGAADYSFVDQEAQWRGSEVHRATELLDRGRLHRAHLPERLRGYVEAYERFKADCHFIPDPEGIEVRLRGDVEGEILTGRADRLGLLRGVRTVGDIKCGALQEATALQLALYGHLADPTKWWPRWAVRLYPTGLYSYRKWERTAWLTDLNTARAFVRIARWKVLHKVVRL